MIPEAAVEENGRMTITEFLEARISEDEAAANRCASALVVPDVLVHTMLDPARVLAECAAKRVVLATRKSIDESPNDDDWSVGYSDANYDAVTALAAVYASHPDYWQEWSQ